MGLAISLSTSTAFPFVFASGLSPHLQLSRLVATLRSGGSVGTSGEPPAAAQELVKLLRSLAAGGTSLEELSGQLQDPSRCPGAVAALVAIAEGLLTAPPGASRLFEPRRPVVEEPPPPERLPEIKTHLEGYLIKVQELLGRLGLVKVWGTPDRKRLPAETRGILDEIDRRLAEFGRLSLGLASLTPSEAPRLSRQVVALDLKVRRLEERIAAHPILGRVFRSEMVDLDWAIREEAPQFEEPTARERTDLVAFFEGEKIEPGYQARIEVLLDRYGASLRAKKGGAVGSLRDEPFDLEAFAAILVTDFDPQVVADTLRFLQTRWGQTVPTVDQVREERDRIASEVARIRAERRPPHPERYTIVTPDRDDRFRDYVRRFGLEVGDAEIPEILGVQAATVLQWGSGNRYPRDIGLLMALYRYLVAEAWIREVLYGRSEGIVELPDPMELLRLAYGERGRHFFESVATDDPSVLVVPVPEAVFDLSYSEMFYGRVLGKMWEAYALSTPRVAAGIRDVYDAGVTPGTYDRHRRGEVMAHRRAGKTRESIRLMMGPGGDIFDFFLEAKSVTDQAAEVELPGDRRLLPEWGRRSQWRVRLVPQHPNIDFSAARPQLDPGRFPYRFLTGERDDFTLLLSELRARLDFMTGVQGRSLDEVIEVGEGTSCTLREIGRTLKDFEERHQRLAARLQYYRSHPAETPFSAPQVFEQFYRRLLLFARTVRERISIGDEVSILGILGIAIRYEVIPPGSAGIPHSPIAARPQASDSSRWVVAVVPDYLVSLAAGLRLSPQRQGELFRLRLAVEVLRERGVLIERDLSRLAVQLLPGLGAAERAELLEQYRSLEGLEAEAREVSWLDEAHPDVQAIYERADQVTSRREEVPPERWPRWIRDRLHEFSWKRFGLAQANVEELLSVLTRYFELHPAYRETFQRDRFEQAITECAEGSGQVRGHLLEFLAFVGLPTGEVVPPKPVTRVSTLPSELRMPRRPQPGALPEVPVYPSRQAVVVEDFLDRVRAEGEAREGLRGFLLQLVGVYEGTLRDGKKLPRADSPEFVGQVREILAERQRLFGLEPSEYVDYAGRGHDLLVELQGFVSRIDQMMASVGESLARPVVRELLLQMICRPSVENLASLTLRLVGAKLGGATPESAGFRKALSATTDWFEENERSVRQRQSDLVGLLEIALTDHGKGTREALFEYLMTQGLDLLPELFRSGHSDQTLALADWEGLLSRHEWEMTLFSPEGRSEVRRMWHEVYDPLPAAPPQPPPPADPARPRTTPEPRPLRLPAPAWNPSEYAYLPSEQHAQFWTRVAELAERDVPAFLIFYLTEEGAQVARVGREDWRRAMEGAVRGLGPRPYPGMFRFTDLESGGVIEVLPTQVRLTVEVDVGVRGFLRRLSELTPKDPSFVDLQLLEALAFYLPLGEEANPDFSRLTQRLMQDRSLWNRRALRGELNRYMERHQVGLARCRNFYSNIGSYHFSRGVRHELARIMLQDPVVSGQFEKVVDLIELHPGLPPEITDPLREAIRVLEALETRTEEDYRRLISVFQGFWPEAMRRDAARLRGMLPPGEEFQPLAEARELVAVNSVDLMVLRHQLERDLGRSAGGGRMGGMMEAALRTALKVCDDPALEPLHRVFQIVLYPQLAPPRLLGAFIPVLNSSARDLFHPRRREGAVQELLRFYLAHRDELLWRLKEKEGTEGFERAANALPDEMPRRFALSAEFPELEGITFTEIDNVLVYLRELLGKGTAPQDAVVVNVDEGGLWRRFFLPPSQVLYERVPVEGEMARVPLGIEVGGQRLYFRSVLRELEGRGILPQLPEGGGEGGVREIRVKDALGQEATVRDDQRMGRVYPLSQLRELSRRRPGVTFESLVLMEDSLRDVHPVLLMIYHTVNVQGPPDTSLFGRVDEIAIQCLRDPTIVRSQAERIRELLLTGYRVFRSQFRAMGVRGRFANHFDNPT